jgi:L-fuconolactonase
MTEAHAAIDRPVLPAELAPELEAAGVAATIAVQSACTAADSDFLLTLAAEHDWIAAVVAWVDLERPAAAEAWLDGLVASGRVRGVRHLIHDEPDPHWILRKPVLRSLELVEERGLVLELPAVWPRHVGDVPALAERFPSLCLVIDHLAKPPLDGDFDVWGEAVRRAAAHPHVWAKFSGVDASVLEPALEIALETFGPRRLMWGSDWPVCLLTTTYADFHSASLQAVARLAPADASDLLGGNAARLYGLEAVADYAGGGARGAH